MPRCARVETKDTGLEDVASPPPSLLHRREREIPTNPAPTPQTPIPYRPGTGSSSAIDVHGPPFCSLSATNRR